MLENRTVFGEGRTEVLRNTKLQFIGEAINTPNEAAQALDYSDLVKTGTR